MKFTNIVTLMVFAAFLAFAGCNSAVYEIIEVEEPVEFKEEVKQPESDIKTDTDSKNESIGDKSVVEETRSVESKYTEKQVISRTYVVQIGAYINESSAEKLIRKASARIADPNITYKLVDGLYKVRLSREFTDKNEAIEYLKTIWALRFGDSFVVEVTKVKAE